MVRATAFVKKQPLFIVGASRSGTTMFRLMLNSHPDIHIPPEAWFLGELVTRLPRNRSLSQQEVREAKEIILQNERWSDWKCPVETLDSALLFREAPDLAELIQTVFFECSFCGCKLIWGEKSPRHSHLITQIHEIYPQAKFIHLIRDGVDSCMSIFDRGWYDRNFRRICEHWNSTVCSARQAKRFGGDCYLEIHYEDLVRDPESQLKTVCEFLGLPFFKSMLQYESRIAGDIAAGESNLHSSLNDGLKSNLIGIGHRKMTVKQKIVFNIICGKTNFEMGYRYFNLKFYEKLTEPVILIFLWIEKKTHNLIFRLKTSRLLKK